MADSPFVLPCQNKARSFHFFVFNVFSILVIEERLFVRRRVGCRFLCLLLRLGALLLALLPMLLLITALHAVAQLADEAKTNPQCHQKEDEHEEENGGQDG